MSAIRYSIRPCHHSNANESTALLEKDLTCDL